MASTNPNQLPPPNPDLLHNMPDINQPLPEAKWHQQEAQLDAALLPVQDNEAKIEALREQYINVDGIDRHTVDNLKQVQDLIQANMVRKQAAVDTARRISQDSDPTAVINHLQEVALANQTHHTEAEDKIAGKVDGAVRASRTLLKEQSELRRARRQAVINPVTLRNPEDRAKVEKARQHAIDTKAQLHVERVSDHDKAQIGSRDAYQRASENLGRARASLGIADILILEREQILDRGELVVAHLEDVLHNSAPITGSLDVAHEKYLTEQLNDLSTTIDQLSIHDPERADLLENRNRLLFRLKQRQINDVTVQGGTYRRAEFSHDNGIFINKGQSEEALIYENGDIGRIVTGRNGQLQLERVRPSGEVSRGPDTKPIEQIAPHRAERSDFPEDELKRWDALRTPESTARAHAEIGAYTAHYEARQDHIENEVTNGINALQANQDLITQKTDEIRDLKAQVSVMRSNGLPSTDPNVATAIQALNAAEKAHKDAQTALPVIHAKIQNDKISLEDTRRYLGPANYWKGVLETRMVPKPAEEKRKRRIASMFMKKSVVPPVLPPRADIMPDGSVVWENLKAHDSRSTDHRSQVGKWQYLPDGSKQAI